MLALFQQVFRRVKREAQRFNAENRAFRELDKQQKRPKTAPKHEADINPSLETGESLGLK